MTGKITKNQTKISLTIISNKKISEKNSPLAYKKY